MGTIVEKTVLNSDGTTYSKAAVNAPVVFKTATIADGAGGGGVSGVVETGGATLCNIIVPASFEGGYVQFQIADASDGTFVTLCDATSGDPIRYKAASSKAFPVDKPSFVGVAFLKVCSVDVSGNAVNQTGAAAVRLAFLP